MNPTPSATSGRPCDSYELPCQRNGRCHGRERFVYTGTERDGLHWFMGDYDGVAHPMEASSPLDSVEICPFSENIKVFIQERKPRSKGRPAAFTGTPFDLLMMRVNK